MPPTTSPAPLVNIWGATHGVTFYAGEFICAEPGLLISAGVVGSAMGVTSVVFDDATGEPLDFASNAAISPGTSLTPLGVWHFPAESCVVIAAYKSGPTAADSRLWARRVYYDSAGNLTTPDPLTTWSPALLGAGGQGAAVGPSSSSTLNAIWLATDTCKTAILDLGAGSAGSVASHSLATIFGGSIDRTQLAIPLVGHHPDAALLSTAYVNAAGVTTAQTYIAASSGGTPTSTLVSASRMTSSSGGVPEDDRTYMTDVGGLGGTTWRLTDPGGLFQDAPPPTANFIYTYTPRSPHTGTGHLDSHNREDLTYGTVSGSNDKRRVREFDPDTGAEIFAWEYPGFIAAHPTTGRLVKRGQFWFSLSSTTFDVYEGDYPREGGLKVGFLQMRPS